MIHGEKISAEAAKKTARCLILSREIRYPAAGRNRSIDGVRTRAAAPKEILLGKFPESKCLPRRQTGKTGKIASATRKTPSFTHKHSGHRY